MAVASEDVEDDVADRDPPAAMEHPLRQSREAREAVLAKCDQFAVQDEPLGQTVQLRDCVRHVPAAPASDGQAVPGRDERPKPIPLDLERVARTPREIGRAREHRSRQHRANATVVCRLPQTFSTGGRTHEVQPRPDLVAELGTGIGAQRIGIQAKCLGANRTVGPNTVRLLRDALTTRQCNAGAVIATCRFENAAIEVADEAGKFPVELVDHNRLIDLALEFKVGIRTEPLDVYREDLKSAFSTEDTKPPTSGP